MPRAKRSIQAATTIEGFSLIWHLHREQQWCDADGWKGAAIRVSVAESARRELLLEYPAKQTQKIGWTRVDPARPTIVAAKVEAHIRQAMAAGWDPDSRGKPFVYQVAELPS
jgi:hypothetical protein